MENYTYLCPRLRVHMDLTKKRHIASWVLLAVFVPMLVFSSLHIHSDRTYSEAECAECVAHHCHGHLIQTDASIGECVLCQFLSLTYTAAVLAVVSFVFNVSRTVNVPLLSIVFDTSRDNIVTRGPPAALLAL